MTETDYPTTSPEPSGCKYDASKVAVDVKVIEYVTENAYISLEEALIDTPVLVMVDASSKGFLNYSEGIYKSLDCGTEVNHVMLAVGWGLEDGLNYLILKNTWDATWGEKGYMRIEAVPG